MGLPIPKRNSCVFKKETNDISKDHEKFPKPGGVGSLLLSQKGEDGQKVSTTVPTNAGLVICMSAPPWHCFPYPSSAVFSQDDPTSSLSQAPLPPGFLRFAYGMWRRLEAPDWKPQNVSLPPVVSLAMAAASLWF